MDLLQDGWFCEKSSLWPGRYLALKVEQVLHHEKSPYQDILMLQTTDHGRALVLDGIIQCTERDEFAYQEMMSFVPLCAHGDPQKVLIVGGGDGGVARDVARHPTVEEVHQVEIDERVVHLSKQYLPFMACGFDDPKVHLHIGDGLEFLRKRAAEFDVIITDSSDPVGPNETLFREDYFRLLKRALRPGGVVCSQAGCPWIDLDQCTRIVNSMRNVFGQTEARLATASVPTYPAGQIGLAVACEAPGADPADPRLFLDSDRCRELGLRYYTGDVHRAAFALPHFMVGLM